MKPSGIDLHHLAGVYALNALDADELALFEAHLHGCELCQREVVEFCETAGLLALATAQPIPQRLRNFVDAVPGKCGLPRWASMSASQLFRRVLGSLEGTQQEFDSVAEETEQPRHA